VKRVSIGEAWRYNRAHARIAALSTIAFEREPHEAGMRLLRGSLLNKEIDYRDLVIAGIPVTDKLLVREAARIWEAYLRSRP